LDEKRGISGVVELIWAPDEGFGFSSLLTIVIKFRWKKLWRLNYVIRMEEDNKY